MHLQNKGRKKRLKNESEKVAKFQSDSSNEAANEGEAGKKAKQFLIKRLMECVIKEFCFHDINYRAIESERNRDETLSKCSKSKISSATQSEMKIIRCPAETRTKQSAEKFRQEVNEIKVCSSSKSPSDTS